MAQTGYTPILIYSSSTATNTPLAANLTNSTLGSELAINIADGKLFYKDSGGVVQVIGWKVVPTTAGGTGLTSYTAGDTLYYASGTTLSKLAIGTAYYMMGVNSAGTAPSWQPSSTSTLTTQGDLLYASAANTLARLAKNTTASRYLSNSGASNNPAWAQIDLTNGVTGTLPIANGGTNQTSFTGKSGNIAGLVYFDGTSLTNNATVSNVGYDTTANILYAAGLTNLGNVNLGNNSGTNDLSISGAVGSSFVTVGRLSSTSGDNTQFAVQNRLGAQTFLVNPGGNGSAAVTGTLSVTRGVTLCSVTGDTNTGVGNIVQGTAAKGFNFTANTPAAGMTSQLLNWYEEGTFTPTVVGATTAGTTTYTTQTGKYTRVGRLVTAYGYIAVTGMTGTGNLSFNLPFSSSGGEYNGSAMTNNLPWPNAGSITFVAEGSTARLFVSSSNASWSNVNISNTTWSIYYTVTYMV